MSRDHCMIERTIVLVAYYGDEWLENCLFDLPRASTPKLHLLLADNHGNELLHALELGQFRYELIRLNGPKGFAEANNDALVASKDVGEYVVFLNQDTISQPRWIDQCISLLENHPEIGALSPLIRNYDDTKWDPSFLDCLSEKQILLLQEGHPPEVIYTDHVPAPSLIIRKSVLAKVGPFDPIYGSYYEDYDLCARIRKAGYAIGFCGRARIQHYSGSATNNQARRLKRMRQIIRNRGIYWIRHGQGTRLKKVAALFFLDFPRRFLRGLLHTPSSQPYGVVASAYRDLLQEVPRLLSSQRDGEAFRRYLRSIGWDKFTRQ